HKRCHPRLRKSIAVEKREGSLGWIIAPATLHEDCQFHRTGSGRNGSPGEKGKSCKISQKRSPYHARRVECSEAKLSHRSAPRKVCAKGGRDATVYNTMIGPPPPICEVPIDFSRGLGKTSFR